MARTYGRQNVHQQYNKSEYDSLTNYSVHGIVIISTYTRKCPLENEKPAAQNFSWMKKKEKKISQ
jgi:hypothetical protein